MYYESENEWISQEKIRQRYAEWWMAMLDVYYQARCGYNAFLDANQLRHLDKAVYRQKGWIPFDELRKLMNERGISIQEARKLRNEYRIWLEAIRWSDPERIHRKLARKAMHRNMN